MPREFIKMKKAFVKEYGKKRGTEIAAKTWNKRNAGTGRTVGRGRR